MNSEHRHTSDMGHPERLIKRSGWSATVCPNLAPLRPVRLFLRHVARLLTVNFGLVHLVL